MALLPNMDALPAALRSPVEIVKGANPSACVLLLRLLRRAEDVTAPAVLISDLVLSRRDSPYLHGGADKVEHSPALAGDVAEHPSRLHR